MPAVLEKPEIATEVDEQIAQATSRIRFHDVAFGGLLLVAMLLVYATAMIVIDKFLVLPDWVRQLGLLGFIGAAAGTAYLTIVRPLRRRVNPLYAAVQVEKTIDNAKNSVVGYVEAQDNEAVHPAVKAAMGARAAKSVVEADINHAIDHRSLAYSGAVVVVFFLALVVLFFVFRPAQFKSLAARTFAPFTSEGIASRTQITLLEPVEGDVTITTGQSVTIKVNVGGKVPSPDKPDRMRVLIRHNQAVNDYEEIAMEKGEISREWQVRVPDYLVRNGFWYKVAGGDAETTEHRVSVRSLPLFTDLEVSYEYPPYTRLKPETSKDGHIRALRGTRVTVLGKTNRTVKDGKITFDPPTRDPLLGKVPADKPNSIQFQFLLTASGQYRPVFTSSEGERSPEPPPFKIEVDEDLPPNVVIVKPELDEVTLPANGQLAVDGTVTDDLGIDKLTLKLRIAMPAMRDLADKPFQDGKSFRRDENDGTFSWPRNLEYKDSVDFTKLTDAAGQPVTFKEGMILEYWLEATDNRSKIGSADPEPNVGKSAVKTVRIAPPVMAMEEKKNLDQKKDQRNHEEKAHNQAQQKRLDNEKRTPQQPNQPGAQKEPETKQADEGTKPDMPPIGMPEKKNDNTPPMDKKGPDMPPMGMPETKGPDNMPMKSPMPQGGMPEMNPPMPMNNMGQPNTAPMPGSPEDKKNEEKTREEANRLQEELNKQNSPGTAKSGPSQSDDKANPAEPKPMPMGEPPPDSGSKEPPKPNDPMNPMMGSSASESKSMGNPNSAPPENPAETKPEPKKDMNPMGGGGPSASKEPPKNMDPTKGGPASDKDTPPMGGPMPNETKSPGMGKAATQQPQSGNPMNPMEPNPADGAAKSKPMPNNDPSAVKPEPKPMGGNTQDPMNKPENDSGMGKASAGPPPADSKNTSKSEPMPGAGASEPKPMPEMGNAGATKPEGGNSAKASDKPSGEKNAAGSGQKPTPEQMKEFQDAVKDLNSKDPNKQKAAQDKLDKMVGEQTRKDIEKDLKDFEKNVQNLQSKDDKTRKDAQNKLDKQVGEQNRKDIEDIQKGLNSSDEKERQKAEERLKELQAKAGAGDKQPPPKGGEGSQPSKIDPKDV